MTARQMAYWPMAAAADDFVTAKLTSSMLVDDVLSGLGRKKTRSGLHAGSSCMSLLAMQLLRIANTSREA